MATTSNILHFNDTPQFGAEEHNLSQHRRKEYGPRVHQWQVRYPAALVDKHDYYCIRGTALMMFTMNCTDEKC
jgi:hypothetical protein